MHDFNSQARLDRLAAQVGSVGSQRELLELLSAEIRNSLGYRTTWIAVMSSDASECRVLTTEVAGGDDLWDSSVPIPIEGDPFLSMMLESTEPQVVVDAQTEVGVNREIVEELGNRTIINVPIRFDDRLFAAVGTGTFGEEGPRPPSAEDLDHLSSVAAIGGAALADALRLAGHIA
jgi:GAF domain-containing protein